jgi:broad specificity phosphatase PhoE
VLCLQPRDFTAARRGLDDYVRDLSNGGISFRRYEWNGDGSPRQVTDRAPSDERHAGEYAFHIIRNLIRNYAKLISGSNVVLGDDELDAFVARHIPSAAPLLPEFRELRAQKASGERRFGPGATALAVGFVNAFSADHRATWESGVRHVWWIRHAPTEHNDGTFFGQGRDAEPNGALLEGTPRLDVASVYSSPARRTLATARRVSGDARLIEDPRLLEQDYGAAEGMTVRDLAANYPAMTAAWKRGEDPAFPQGESSRDVRLRLGAFIQDLIATGAGDVAVVTHNVVMREVLGQILGVPPAQRYRLVIPHLQQFETIQHDDKLYPQLTLEQKAALTDSLVSE